MAQAPFSYITASFKGGDDPDAGYSASKIIMAVVIVIIVIILIVLIAWGIYAVVTNDDNAGARNRVVNKSTFIPVNIPNALLGGETHGNPVGEGIDHESYDDEHMRALSFNDILETDEELPLSNVTIAAPYPQQY